MINYAKNPTVIDYDENARKRRIAREKNYKNMKMKKVTLPPTTSLSGNDDKELDAELEKEINIDEKKVTKNKKRKRKTKQTTKKQQFCHLCSFHHRRNQKSCFCLWIDLY